MSDSWTAPIETTTPAGRIRTPAGGHAMTDEEYNRKWFERLVKRTVLNAKGCFVWQGPLSSKGYIMHTHRKWQTQAHRNVYRLTHRVELTREQQVCHSCDERRCWNPGHLFLGSNQDNCKDMAAKKRHQNNRKLVCKWGHPFTPENTRINVDKRGWTHRACLACEDARHRAPPTPEQIARRRARQKAYRAEKRQQVPQPREPQCPYAEDGSYCGYSGTGPCPCRRPQADQRG